MSVTRAENQGGYEVGAFRGGRRKVPASCGALGPGRIWPMEQVQRKMWGNQGGGEETKIALFRLGKGGKG